MAKDTPHFKKDGSLFKGAMHKMPDGTLHSGKKHTKTSEKLFHLKDLPKGVKRKALVEMLKAKDKDNA
tara:strand:- start:4980 stop:5183 length:204 start_codon:yes stop_codon:yes gene_type:complete